MFKLVVTLVNRDVTVGPVDGTADTAGETVGPSDGLREKAENWVTDLIEI